MNVPARRWIPWILLASVVFCGLLYVWGTHSAGYMFLEQAVRKSSSIQQRVGDVQTVRLRGYHDKTDGSKEWVTMTLRVTGSKGEVTVTAAAKRVDGAWSVSHASIDGVPVVLN
jgi:hypothetical protein